MKKTLIALAVSASAVVSGSAMAWNQGGLNSGIDIGGTLTPDTATVIPWEAKVGAAVTALDSQIQQGQTTATVPVDTTIPVLGIRTLSATGFEGNAGLTPQISYGDTVNFGESVNGVAPVTLTVTNTADQSNIGTLTTSMTVVSRLAWKRKTGNRAETFNVGATDAGHAFYGGVGASRPAISATASVSDGAALFPEVTDRFTDFGGTDIGSWIGSHVGANNSMHSGFYASAVKTGSVINLTLNTPATTDAINWTARLPVTVSYQ